MIATLDNMLFCSTNLVWPQTMNVFTLPGEIRLCANPHSNATLHMCASTQTNTFASFILIVVANLRAKAFQAVSTGDEMRSVALC